MIIYDSSYGILWNRELKTTSVLLRILHFVKVELLYHSIIDKKQHPIRSVLLLWTIIIALLLAEGTQKYPIDDTSPTYICKWIAWVLFSLLDQEVDSWSGKIDIVFWNKDI